MERQPHPIDGQGLPYVPDDVLEINCGGEVCADKPGLHCPDSHHLYAERGRFTGFIAMYRLATHKSMQEPLRRCQHEYLHQTYDIAPQPSAHVVAVEIERRGITVSKRGKKQLRKLQQGEQYGH